MKHKTLNILALFALAICIGGMSLGAWDTMKGSEAQVMAQDMGEFYAPGAVYEKTWAVDTITDAENDTLYLPSNMRPVVSDFLQAWAIKRTNISGTTAVAVKIEESNYRYSGSTPPTAGWVATLNSAGSAAATAATTATEEELRIGNSWGMSYRCIVDGTGTQSSSYVIRAVLKKKE